MAQTASEQDELDPLGERLRSIRRRRGLTLKETALRAGISESFLSQVERGKASLSLASLQRVAASLDLTVADLFERYGADEPQVLRRDARPVLDVWELGQKMLLTPRWLHNLEALVCRLDVGGSTGREPYTHGDSEELFFVLSGRVELELDGDLHPMSPGDSIVYRSSTPHRVVNVGDEPAEGLWVMSPPSF